MTSRILDEPSSSRYARMSLFYPLSHLIHLCVLLLVRLIVPNNSGMRPKRKQQAYDITEEEAHSRKPDVRPDGLGIEPIVQRGCLVKVASSTIAISASDAILGAAHRWVLINALMASHLVASVHLVEQCRSKGADHREQEHGRCNSCRSDIEALRLPLDGSETHAEAWEEQYPSEYRTDDAAFHELRFAFFQGDAIQEDLDDSAEECVDRRSDTHSRLCGDGCDCLSDKVCKRNNRGQSQYEHQAERSQEYPDSQCRVEDKIVEDDKSHQAEEVEKEDVRPVDGVLPIPTSHSSVCAE